MCKLRCPGRCAMTFDALLKKPILTDDGYKAYVHALYDEWQGYRKTGTFPTADRLAAYMEGIAPSLPPQFFAGKLDSPVVQINLNPHAGGKGSASEVPHEPYCKTWEKYWSYWQHFAHERYAEDGLVVTDYRSRNKKLTPSGFDNKLLYFFASAAGIQPDEKMHEKLATLGLEFVPLNSAAFKLKKKDDYIRLYIKRMVDVLFLHERKLVIILNGTVCDMLCSMKDAGFTLENLEKKQFKVKKNNGEDSKQNICASRFELCRNDGKKLNIVAATSFAMQGLNSEPLACYARQLFTAEEKQTVKQMLSR